MSIELHERAVDTFRNLKGEKKPTLGFWKKNKAEIIEQGMSEDRKQKQQKRR